MGALWAHHPDSAVGEDLVDGVPVLGTAVVPLAVLVAFELGIGHVQILGQLPRPERAAVLDQAMLVAAEHQLPDLGELPLVQLHDDTNRFLVQAAVQSLVFHSVDRIRDHLAGVGGDLG